MDAALSADPAVRKALAAARRALNSRDRTAHELRAFLERRKVEPDIAELVLAELEAAGAVDDARYARRFTEDKRELEHWGSRRIAGDLERRGVGAEHVAAALGDRGHDEELSSALALLAQRLPGPPEDDAGRDKAWRLLVRRGYEPELAYAAVREHERR